ncbi:hypothetical protein OROMI_025025 [Orobanche minor]
MRQPNSGREIPGAMNSVNTVMNHHEILSLQDIHNHGQSQMLPSSNFEPSSPHDDFLEQILSSVHPSAAAFPWADDHPSSDIMASLGDQPPTTPQKMRQQQISMLPQQLLLPTGLGGGGVYGGQMPQGDQNDVVDAPLSSDSAHLINDASLEGFFNGFTGSLAQSSNQSQHFHHSQGGVLQQNFGTRAVSASSGGGTASQPKQRVRARRGQATDPHSIAERLRRERIAERMKSLQELVPNANKTDKASMLDEIIDYVKYLQLQVKVLSVSRLGGASAAVAPLVINGSSEGKGDNGMQTAEASSSNNDEGMTVAERQVAKMLEEDMGSAMQYLQGKGLCLMPISLATAISTATSHNPVLNGDTRPPTSPSISVLTVQSATIGGQVSLKHE